MPIITSLAEAEVLLFSCNFITDVLIRDKGKINNTLIGNINNIQVVKFKNMFHISNKMVSTKKI